ncbi:hypothetical protein Tco_0726957 [Tanacetum coccineum]|uniref:Uncharacterized protein n=1 Tax=Tanacetum coccineum TaxID=301880 RepID=A0ABQ4YI08_9ASTR
MKYRAPWRYYYLARRVHDKVKGLRLSPEMQVIADKLLQIEAHTELINHYQIEDGVDPLIMVVGPEHGEAKQMPVSFPPRTDEGSLCYGGMVYLAKQYNGEICATVHAKWDVLSNGGSMQEMARITNGRD